MYKLPVIRDSENELFREGVGQVYMDVNNQQWVIGDKAINETGHAIYHTLQQLYAGSKSEVTPLK